MIKGRELSFDRFLAPRRDNEQRISLKELHQKTRSNGDLLIDIFKKAGVNENELTDIINNDKSKRNAAIAKASRLVKGADLNTLKEIREKLQKYNNSLRDTERLANIIDNNNFQDTDIAYAQNYDEFIEPAEMLDKLNEQTLFWLRKAGIIDNEKLKTFLNTKGYVAFRRDMVDEIIGEAVNADSHNKPAGFTSLKAQKGSQLDIISPYNTMKNNYIKATIMSTRQIILNTIGDNYNNLTDIMQKVPTMTVKQDGKYIQDPKQLRDEALIKTYNDKGKNVFYKINGELKKLLDETLSFENRHIAMKALILAKKTFTMGTTGIYPSFVINNTIIDNQSAYVVSKNGFKPFVSPAETARLLAIKDPQTMKLWGIYNAVAGRNQTRFGMDNANDYMQRAGEKPSAFSAVLDTGNRVLETLAIPNTTAEMLTRFSEFRLAVKNGKSVLQAFEDAGNVSGSFHKIGNFGGAVGRDFVRSVGYFNAAIQSMYQVLKNSMKGDKLKRFVIMAACIAIGNFFANRRNQKEVDDDELKKEMLQNIPLEMAGMYIYFTRDGENKGFFRIRQEQIFQTLANIMIMTINQIAYDYKYGAGDYVEALGAAIPAQIDITKPTSAFLSLLPTGLKPAIETTLGMKDFPRVSPIVPQYLKNRQPKYQYTDRTSDVAKAIGSAINVSPIKIDFLAEGYFGRSLKLLTHSSEIVKDPAKYINDNFIPFTQKENFWYGRKMQKYYEKRNKFDAIRAAINRGDTIDDKDQTFYDNYVSDFAVVDGNLRAARETDKIARQEVDKIMKDKSLSLREQNKKAKETLDKANSEKNKLISGFIGNLESVIK
jgi:hypothetical protein